MNQSDPAKKTISSCLLLVLSSLHNFAKKIHTNIALINAISHFQNAPDRFHDLGTTHPAILPPTHVENLRPLENRSSGSLPAKLKPTAKCGAQEERAAITRSIVSVNLVGVE
jgi:hypothetical protein